MQTELLDAFPLWALLLMTIALLCLAMEVGYRAGRWRHARHPDEREQPVGAMVASVLGLLALVLAFTFNLAASRFEARRQTILEEANAIGTTYLRAQILPEPQRTTVTRLLKEYLDVRIRGAQEGRIEELLVQSESLHKQLWAQAVSVAEQTPNSIMTGLFIQTLNDTIDLHAKRVRVGLHNRIPLVIWVILISLAVLGLGAVGYQAGLGATRRSPAMLALVLAFASVLLLIADLDRVHEGLIRISQQSLIDVQTSMQSNSP